MFFNKDTAEEGREALGWYYEKKSTNPEGDIGLGPNHDWSSHAADAFGLMCIPYDQPDGAPPRREGYRPRSSKRWRRLLAKRIAPKTRQKGRAAMRAEAI